MESTAIAAHPPGAPRKVFISYARKDREFALLLAGDLGAKDWGVWIDTKIQGGDDWLEKLNEGLQASEEVILVLSPSAKASKWVKREVLAAFNREKHVTPVLHRKCGGWDLIGDVEPIDFSEWYDEGFAKLIGSTIPRRTFGRKVLIILNKISRPFLYVLALTLGITAYIYFLSPSNTSFIVSGGDKSAITVRVHNRGAKPSMLFGSSFKLSFGSLPIETEPLVLLQPEKHIRIAGHSDEVISLMADNMLKPKIKSEDSYYSREDIAPLLPGAKLTLTAQVKESDGRLLTRSEVFPVERIQNFVLEESPYDVP